MQVEQDIEEAAFSFRKGIGLPGLFIKFMIRCEISRDCHPEPFLAKDLPRMSQT